jgi:hypothetical protein
MTRFLPGAALAAAAIMVLSGPAQAQDYVRLDCQSLTAPAKLHFDSPEHARWYRRFWTGDCDHLGLCMPGSPNWNDIVGKLLAKGGPSEQAALLPKACRLGQLIGLEWSREHDVRRIDTNDLRSFKSLLEAAGDPLRGLGQVEALAQTKVSRPSR